MVLAIITISTLVIATVLAYKLLKANTQITDLQAKYSSMVNYVETLKEASKPKPKPEPAAKKLKSEAKVTTTTTTKRGRTPKNK